MRDFRSAPSVVVGVDGSSAASNTAVWAVDEAVSRDIPLRPVYVIDPTELCGADSDHRQFASARAALYDAQRAAEADNLVLRRAFEEARLRGAPLRVVASWRAEAPDDVGAPSGCCVFDRRRPVEYSVLIVRPNHL